MNRLKRMGGALALTAALVVGSIGVMPAQAPAVAAETTVSLEDFKTAMTAVGEKIKTLAQSGTLKTSISGDVSVMDGMMKLPLEIGMDIDATSKVGHGRMPVLNGEAIMGSAVSGKLPYTDMYMDLANNCMYILDETSGTKLINAFPAAQYMQGFGVGPAEGNMFTTMFSSGILDLLKDYMTLTSEDTTLDGVPCKKIVLTTKIEKGTAAKLVEEVMKKLPEALKSGMPGNAAAMDPKALAELAETSTDTIYLGADGTPLKMVAEGTATGLAFNGMSLGTVAFNLNIGFAASTESLSIPEDRKTGVILAPNNVTSTGGLTFMSGMTEKGKPYFSVTKVDNTKAKKLTIPAKVTALGQTVSVTQVSEKAFSKAKKLKTLIVKSASVKKALKKNPSKYGLSKKVKIK